VNRIPIDDSFGTEQVFEEKKNIKACSNDDNIVGPMLDENLSELK
jgi:hypothetical protein